MPIEHRVERGTGLLILVLTGVVTSQDSVNHWLERRSQPGYRPHSRVLVDCRDMESLASVDHVKRLADMANRGPSTPGGVLWAIVVGTEAGFGMARMFAALSARSALDIEVFRDEGEARRWLGVVEVRGACE